MCDLTLVAYKMMREKDRERERESKQPSPVKKSRRGCKFVISHLSIQNRNGNVA